MLRRVDLSFPSVAFIIAHIIARCKMTGLWKTAGHGRTRPKTKKGEQKRPSGEDLSCMAQRPKKAAGGIREDARMSIIDDSDLGQTRPAGPLPYPIGHCLL